MLINKNLPAVQSFDRWQINKSLLIAKLRCTGGCTYSTSMLKPKWRCHNKTLTDMNPCRHQNTTRFSAGTVYGDLYSQLQLFLKTLSCSLWVCGWRMEQKMNKSKTMHESSSTIKKVRKTWRDSPWIVGVRLETWDVGLRHQTWHLGWFQSERSCGPVLFIIIIIIMSTGVLLWSSQLLLVSSELMCILELTSE